MKKTILTLLVLFSTLLRAQIAGTFTVPGSFPTIAAAINTLNTQGVAGAVTINVQAGYTETAPVGGFKLFNPVGSSSTNSVVFQKLGAGANPLITAYTGTAPAGFNVQDGVWWLIGADYITIDGIDLVDLNTTQTGRMEFGYGLYREHAGNGCQFNTIKNCSITLNQFYGIGIDVAPSSYTLNQSVLSTTSAAGANMNNRFYGNVINNIYQGISMRGVPNTVTDMQNDVGGTTAATGNTITGFGANGSGRGVWVTDQYSLNISNNYISNVNTSTAYAWIDVNAIRTGTAPGSNVTILNNTITLFSNNTSSISTLNGIYNEAGSSTPSFSNSVNISGNVFPSYNFTTMTTGSMYYFLLYNTAYTPSVTMNNNTVTNVNTGKGILQIMFASSARSADASNNIINNVNHNNGSIFSLGCSGNTVNLSNNYVGNVVSSSTISGNCMSIGPNSFTYATVSNNTVTNVTALGNNPINVNSYYSNSNCLISNNFVTNCHWPTNAYPINPIFLSAINMIGGPNNQAQGSGTITGNTIYSMTCNSNQNTGTYAQLAAINCSVANAVVSRNKIYNVSSTFNTRVIGILQAPYTTASIYNNVIGELNATASSQSLSAVAFSSTPSNTTLIAYNSVYLNNPVNTGTNTGTAILSLDGDGSFTIYNNIFYNRSLPTGSGVSSIIRTNTTTLGFYASGSNRNLFYTGAPQVNTNIFFNGVTSYSLLSTFKTAVAPREALSITENPPFLTILGSSPSALNISPSIPTQIEGGALPLAGISNDYAATARNTVTPDIGAWEGNYIKADATAPIIQASGFTGPPCNTASRTFTATIRDTSGVATGSLAPRLYYKVNFGLYTSVQGVLTAGTTSLGTWAFNLTYVASLNDVIYYFIAAQDASNLNNLLISPVNGTGSDVNTIALPPNPSFNYTLETFPTISVSNGTLCSGYSYSLSPTGAGNYTYSGGSGVVSPLINTSYTITGASPGGCPATNTVVATVSVSASPSITVNSGTICLGQNFTIVPQGALSYTYAGGSSVVNPSSNTSYTVVGSNAIGCISAPAIANVTVFPSTIGTPSTFINTCSQQSITLSGTNGTGFTWSGGVQNNVPFVPGQSGTYTLTGIDPVGCAGTVVVTVNLNPGPSINFSPATPTICLGESVTLTAFGAVSFTWLPTGVNDQTLSVSPNNPGTFTITGTGLNGCVGTSTVFVSVDLCTGLTKQTPNAGTLVFPNPSNGSIQIMNTETEEIELVIYNALSQLVYQKNHKHYESIQLPLVPGLYTLNTFDGKTIRTVKLIILEH